MISDYPRFVEISLSLRPLLHPRLQQLQEEISEYTFANLFLFRRAHHYRIAKLLDDSFVIVGNDGGKPFFMLPFGLVEENLLTELFSRFETIKCVPESKAQKFRELGYSVIEDRDNFDYLYSQKDLACLSGRKFDKKRNLIKAFINHYTYEGKPLLEEYFPDAMEVLEKWKENREEPGDYAAAREALENMEELQLCGGVYYVDGKPVAYSLGEEIPGAQAFVIHFEKAVSEYKGLWQFVNQAFASILPEKYTYINREQDLGDPGLRKAKLSYNPVKFAKKYRAFPSADPENR